ncbi:hypothetical protein [Zavarzinella formosa]|uniref:hypothetical protein n=1 Tax=Zavarzinella formosa TaxID=360055 RepID=UPI00035E7BC6|nr:hypothetical protein [Zavarzinella formosa]
MAATVRIENEAFGDPRIQMLGMLSGYNSYEALGRMAHLWRVCTERESYIVDSLWINICLGPKGTENIVHAGLAEVTEEGIRIKGTEGRIEWLKKARESGKVGGQASAKARIAKAKSASIRASSNPTSDPTSDPQPTLERPLSDPQPTLQATLNQPYNGGSRVFNPLTPSLIKELPSVIPLQDEPTKPPAQPPPRKPKARTPRDDLFDAIVEVTGSLKNANRGIIGKVSAALFSEEPPITPDEVRQFGKRFHELCPWAGKHPVRHQPTPGELQNHVGKVRSNTGSTGGIGRPGRAEASPDKYAGFDCTGTTTNADGTHAGD